MSNRRFLFGATAALLLSVLIGCQNSSATSAQAVADSHDAVVVSYPNGGGTVVFVRTANPDAPLCMCSPGAEVSAECKAGAIKYFETGVLNPQCPLTGATWTIVNYTQANPSVN